MMALFARCARGDALCAALYVEGGDGWIQFQRFRNCRCGSFSLLQVRHPRDKDTTLTASAYQPNLKG